MSLEAFENRKTGRFLVERIRIARQRIKDLKSISMKNGRFFFFENPSKRIRTVIQQLK